MKKRIILAVTAAATLLLLLIAVQIVRHKLRMRLVARLPDIELLSADSILFRTGTLAADTLPLLVLYFHPECEFCAAEISDLLEHRDAATGIRFLLVTFASPEEIRNHFRLFPEARPANFTVATDYKGDFVRTFDVKAPPANYLYDRHRKLIRVHKGMLSFEQLQHYLAIRTEPG